jgi:hypothetical protein
LPSLDFSHKDGSDNRLGYRHKISILTVHTTTTLRIAFRTAAAG